MKKRVLSVLLVLLIGTGMTGIAEIPVAAKGILPEYQTIVDAKYDDAQLFSEGYAAVCLNDKWGYIDENGKYLIEPMYDYAASFSEGKAVVGNIMEEVCQAGTEWEYTEKYCELGFIDNQGNYTPLLAENRLWQPIIYEPADGTLKGTLNTDTTLMQPKFQLENCLFEYDWENDKITEPILHYYINDYLLIEIIGEGDGNNAWIFDSNGKMIDPYIYGNSENGESQSFIDNISGESNFFTDKLWGIYSDGMISGEQCKRGIPEKMTYYDINKNEQFSVYCCLPGFSDLKAEEVENAKNRLESMNIDYRFDYYISPFNNGYAWTYIYKNEGIETEEHNYMFGAVEINSYTVRYKESEKPEFALIDKMGNVVFSGDYQNVHYTAFDKKKVLNNDRIVLENTSNKYGAVDRTGKVIIPFEYDDMGVFTDTVTSAKKDGVWYLIDVDGNIVSKTDYDYLAGRDPESKTSLAIKDDELFVVADNKKVSGSEKIAKDKYYNTNDGVIIPNETIVIKDGEKYGYAVLTDGKPQTTVTSVGIKIDWENSTNTAYRVYRAEPGGMPEAISGVIYGNSFVDVNVESNKKYYYMAVPESEGSISVIDENISVETVTPTIVQPENTEKKNYILMKIGSPSMIVGEETLEIDPGRNTAPIVQNGRTLVPIRAIIESMGGSASWDANERKITLEANGHKVQMYLGEKDIIADGETKQMDIAPEIINDRTMLPIRFAAENIGCQIEWIASTSQIVIVF